MIRNLLAIAIILFSLPLLAQQKPETKVKTGTEGQKKRVLSEDDIFEFAEEMPQFKGGQENFYRFLQENLVYPEDMQKAGKEGNVYLELVIDKDGSIYSKKIIRSLSPSADKAALDVFEKMPNWEPGIINGKPYPVKLKIPIMFRLN